MQAGPEGRGAVAGNLTFRGVTRPVTLDVTYNGTSSGLIGGRRMGFSATTVIKRSDFGSTAWQNAVGDDVRLVIETEFARE
jgi:polyisoprenoid-binding protein YceI